MGWNPDGNILASASQDGTPTLMDFKANRKFYSGKTPDGSSFLKFNYKASIILFIFISVDYVCMLHLSINQMKSLTRRL